METIVYTNAFFKASNRRLRQRLWDELLRHEGAELKENGLGAVCLYKTGDKWEAECIFGVIPREVVKLYSESKVFIHTSPRDAVSDISSNRIQGYSDVLGLGRR
jgi:hypothetical protein